MGNKTATKSILVTFQLTLIFIYVKCDDNCDLSVSEEAINEIIEKNYDTGILSIISPIVVSKNVWPPIIKGMTINVWSDLSWSLHIKKSNLKKSGDGQKRGNDR